MPKGGGRARGGELTFHQPIPAFLRAHFPAPSSPPEPSEPETAVDIDGDRPGEEPAVVESAPPNSPRVRPSRGPSSAPASAAKSLQVLSFAYPADSSEEDEDSSEGEDSNELIEGGAVQAFTRREISPSSDLPNSKRLRSNS